MGTYFAPASPKTPSVSFINLSIVACASIKSISSVAALLPNSFRGLPLGLPVAEWLFCFVFTDVRGFWLEGGTPYVLKNATRAIGTGYLTDVPITRSIFPTKLGITVTCIFTKRNVQLAVGGKTALAHDLNAFQYSMSTSIATAVGSRRCPDELKQ